MKDLSIKEENTYYLWTDEMIGENIGIVWEKEYAELIIKALKFYKENKKDQ